MVTKKKNFSEVYKIKINWEIEELYGEINIVGILRSKGLNWAGHVSIVSIGLATRWNIKSLKILY